MNLFVRLFDLRGVALIVERASGVVYSNQAGGTGCLQPEMEGSLVPVSGQHQEDDPDAMEARLAAVFDNGGHFDERMADQVDSVLASAGHTTGVTVDRTRLSDSMEAWIHVRLASKVGDGTIEGLASTTGVLTWPNSD